MRGVGTVGCVGQLFYINILKGEFYSLALDCQYYYDSYCLYFNLGENFAGMIEHIDSS